jgi:hypothetical protein
MTWSLGTLFSLSNILLLSIQTIIYSGLVVSLSILFRISAFFEIKQILADKLTVENFIKTIKKTL